MDGEALYKAFSAALDQDLDEIGFVVSTSEFETGGSDASQDVKPFLVVEHKLAVAYWCLPTLLNYAQTLYLQTKKSSPHDTETLIKTTRVLVIGNADCYYALSTRKRLLLSGHLNFKDELCFLELVFTKYPKSVESWSHRRWVLTQLFKKEDPLQFIDTEMKLCSKVSEFYPKNYYSWSHRQWVLQHISNLEIFVGELKVMEDWARRHVGDHCGFHHREFVLIRIFKLKGINLKDVNIKLRANESLVSSMQRLSIAKEQKVDEGLLNLLRKEFYFAERLIMWYPGHEVIWYHRRFIFFCWSWLVIHFQVEKQLEFFEWKDMDDEQFPLDDYVSPSMEKIDDENLVKWPSMSREIAFARMCMNDSEVINYEQQKQYASKYVLWVLELGINALEKTSLESTSKAKLDELYRERLNSFVKKLNTSSWMNVGIVNMYK